MRPWRTLARRVVFSRPPWMEVAEERVLLPDGREVDGFLSVGTRDFAAIVAITDRAEVVLIRSYKHGPRSISLAVPAGYLEEGEDALAAARRELREETGYESDTWTSLGRFVVDGNYGVATENIFVAHRARRTADPASGDLEDIEVVLIALTRIDGLLRGGEIAQLSSAAALALALLAKPSGS
ncbi:MAG: NUDIX hydrolase [Chloroflexi bacterium]|nr:MAG: NUDIX hydrolase [Chloroflexota bacterium]TMG70159.1 MAG: NUDIX hydrolase [Chloroflexota bacterium]